MCPALPCLAQGYLLVLWGTPVGLLGAAYLLLLVMVLLLPPELPDTAACRQRVGTHATHAQAQRQRTVRQARTTSVTRLREETDAELQQHLLPSGSGDSAAAAEGASRPASSRGCGPCSAASRWLLLVLLALLCAADLSVQYALVVGAIVQDRPLLPPDVAAWIRAVVGIDDTATGPALLLALLRPTLLMAGLAMYRYVHETKGQHCKQPPALVSPNSPGSNQQHRKPIWMSDAA